MSEPDEQLVFILSQDTKWGNYTIHPARAVDQGEFFLYLGRLAETDNWQMSPVEKQIFELCKGYEVSELYTVFGKDKYRTEQLFIDKADEKTLKSVRAYIDKIVERIIRLIMEADLLLFLRESRWDNPHKKNRIHLGQERVKPLLGFFRSDENIRYRLRLSLGDEIIIPSESELKVITEQPALILIDNVLYYLIDNFSGTRLKPFLQKEEVIIPRQNEAAYFRTFILKNICNEDIEVEGFDVVEPEISKKVILSLEQNLMGEPILELSFKYNERVVSSATRKPFIVELKEEDGQYRFYKLARDFAWEKTFVDGLEDLGLHWSAAGYWGWQEKMLWAEAVEWVNVHLEYLKAHHFEFTQERLDRRFYIGGYKLSYVREESSADWFQLKAEIMLDNGYKFYLLDLWENILSGKREYKLKNGLVFMIPEEWFARYSGLLLFGHRNREGKIILQRNQSSLLDNEDRKCPAEINEVMPEVMPPSTLRATLRDYQLKGFHWLYALYKQHLGSCLADDMGLGKTIQTISLLLKYKEESRRKDTLWIETSKQPDLFDESNTETNEESGLPPFYTCLIIAPASVEHNWRNELLKFAPSLTVGSYIGMHRSRMQPALMRWDVVTTTYQTMRNDIDFFSRQHFGIVVFDEAQMFKNRDSQLYQAVQSLHAEHFVALSGTPIENSLSDLWSLMNVINHGLLGNHSSFQKYFIRPIDNGFNELHLTILNRLVKPYILRRTKDEVLQDLPERTDELIFCELSSEQKKVYEQELSKARNQILEQTLEQAGNNRTFNALQAIGRLRQIANHPRMVNVDYKGSSGKIQEVFRMLETLAGSGHKVLLFSDYVKYLDLVAEEMDERGWKYAMLIGTTKDRERQISTFNTDKECQFFLISLKAGGVGINLTEADYVFILDPWWNTAAEEQAISRAHRIGQKQAVFVYRFVTTGTLEERILDIQRKKSRLSDAIINVNNDSIPLTGKDLEHLIIDA